MLIKDLRGSIGHINYAAYVFSIFANVETNRIDVLIIVSPWKENHPPPLTLLVLSGCAATLTFSHFLTSVPNW